MSIAEGIVLGVLIALGLYVAVAYNRFVRQRNQIQNAFAQIDVQLKRRYDLIPNLVEVARQYMQHERDTLEGVTLARQQASAAASRLQSGKANANIDAGSGASWMTADAALNGALGRLMVVAEAYPELKADARMAELSEELHSTENRIGYARQSYNDMVLRFNNSVEQFPANVVAKLFSFQTRPMLEATESAQERRAPRVQF
jgi:LemA protein